MARGPRLRGLPPHAWVLVAVRSVAGRASVGAAGGRQGSRIDQGGGQLFFESVVQYTDDPDAREGHFAENL
eukprot:2632694-Alexandrium_andersonii.AAC.1